MKNSNNELLSLKPIQKFINGLGEQIKKYLGRSRACVVGVGDDGVLYGKGLYQWLCRERGGRKINFTTMDDTGQGLEEEKLKGAKVLLIDNDIVTGTAFHRTMNFIRKRKEKLKIKDIKFAVLCDRIGLADFSIEQYPSPSHWNIKDLDRTDLEIIRSLSQDGRKSFVEIAKEVGLSSVGVKKRVERLLKKDILKIQASLNTEKFYTTSATVGIEAGPKTISDLIKKFSACPLAYNLVKVSGHRNLIVDFIAPNPKRINDLIEKQIRSNLKIRYLEVNLGELPIIPKSHFLPNFQDPSQKCPCQKRCNECEYFL